VLLRRVEASCTTRLSGKQAKDDDWNVSSKILFSSPGSAPSAATISDGQHHYPPARSRAGHRNQEIVIYGERRRLDKCDRGGSGGGGENTGARHGQADEEADGEKRGGALDGAAGPVGVAAEAPADECGGGVAEGGVEDADGGDATREEENGEGGTDGEGGGAGEGSALAGSQHAPECRVEATTHGRHAQAEQLGGERDQ